MNTPDPKDSLPAALLTALRFAAHKHKQQRRKDLERTPYINHPIAVTEVLARIGRVTDLAPKHTAQIAQFFTDCRDENRRTRRHNEPVIISTSVSSSTMAADRLLRSSSHHAATFSFARIHHSYVSLIRRCSASTTKSRPPEPGLHEGTPSHWRSWTRRIEESSENVITSYLPVAIYQNLRRFPDYRSCGCTIAMHTRDLL